MGKAKVSDGPASLRVERVAIDAVHPDPANVRRHDRRNLDAIRASLAAYGQQTPIVVDAKGVVLKGNGTLAAARELGWTHIDAVRTNLGGAEARAYAIADNRTAELAAWDDVALAEQLQAIRAEDDALLDAAGFTGDEVDGLLERLASDMAGEGEGGGDEPGEGDPIPERYEIVVECRDEAHQRQTFEALQGQGFTCRVLTF